MYYSQSDINTISGGCVGGGSDRGGCGVCGSGGVRGGRGCCGGAGVRGGGGGGVGGGGGGGGGATAAFAIAFTPSDLTRFRLRNLNFLRLYFVLHLRNYIQKF